jgi:DNA mismatch repair protein MutS
MQFGEDTVGEHAKNVPLISAIGGALSYLAEVHRSEIPNIKELRIYKESQYVDIDANTRRSLELCEAMRTGEKKGSLLWVLDKTNTGPGARLLRRFVEQPLTDIAEITRRQNAVGELKDAFMKRSDIEDKLDSVMDLERLLTKVICGNANARDLYGIATTLRVMPSIRAILEDSQCSELKRIYDSIDCLNSLEAEISDTLGEDLPFSVREGGMIRKGYDENLDRLREAVDNVNGWLERIANEEREKTGIRTLKIGYNRVFGYFIEVSKSFMDQVPPNYIRKQTLANAERYITDELKVKEAEMLGAKDKICALEYEIFAKLCQRVIENAPSIRRTAALISLLDVYTSLASVADANRYVCPEIEADSIIDIRNGRHPVVEKFMLGEGFVPNDTLLDTEKNRTMLITGPNMAGKSTYMRQTALITLMAQIGSFVPADSARIGIVDKIFTRVGASDDLAGGQSTFMLEMNEVAYILKNATKKSLIIYDEVGRGTSTYDGMSVARAVVEYTNSKKIGCRTMFATHYHELTSLENEYEGIVNYNIAAKKKGENIIFLRKIVKGSTDDSFGIEVARLAGVPAEVTSRAKEVLKSLESGSDMKRAQNQKTKKQEEADPYEISVDTLINAHVASIIRETDPNTLTPMDALTLVYKLKQELL